MKNKRMKQIVGKVCTVLTFINKYIPKDGNTIILYSNLGFRDNIKALYDHLVENKYYEQYHIICSTNEYEKYKKTNKNIMFISPLKGIYYYMRSKYFFYSFGKYPIYPSKEQIVINLWHGMPLKRIGLMSKAEQNLKYNYFTYIIATSKFFVPIMAECFGCDENKVLINGEPRNDSLFKKINIYQCFNIHYGGKKVIYMPTFRNSVDLRIDNSSSEDTVYEKLKDKEVLKVLNNRLLARNIFLFIKPHPLDNFDKLFIEHLSNIIYIDDKIINDKNISLYTLLGNMDALLTDYSSVYFDYLLVDKPIGFIIDDIDNYDLKRGFVIDEPVGMMPGEKIRNLEELDKFFEDLSNDVDNFFEDRKVINNLVNHYKDNKNCERILKITKILKEEL